MAVKALQPSFGGGEYAPQLVGRQDLARYGISARTMLNWRPRPTGGMETREGTVFCAETKDSTKASRLLPFIVAEELAYVIELGHLYMRFYFHGARLEVAGVPVEVATPWTADEIADVRYTQSADTLFLVHGSHKPRLLKRTGADSFALSTFVPREGPFRSLNGNEALLLSASAATGNATVTSNFDLFTADMVGGLVYLEPQSLGNILPWSQGERSPGLFVGALRRSDGKVYRATRVTVPGGGIGLNYCECGNIPPVHEQGREWDGPGTSKKYDADTSFVTGVEWEYVHSGYGVVEITGCVDARTVTSIVRKTLPPEVVGGLGTPGGVWTLSGDGATKTFPIAGATSDSTANYTVEIAGAPVQSDPNYRPPSGGGAGGGGGGSSYINDEIGPVYVP